MKEKCDEHIFSNMQYTDKNCLNCIKFNMCDKQIKQRYLDELMLQIEDNSK